MTEHALEQPVQPAVPAVTGPAAELPVDEPDLAFASNGGAPLDPAPEAASAPDGAAPFDPPTACTQAQLRRFVKSRPYVPLHELRRRFALNGEDDDVSPVDVQDHRVFVGLPTREAGMLGELLRHGEVGYELLLDPSCPMIVGVFPMRPVQRA